MSALAEFQSCFRYALLQPSPDVLRQFGRGMAVYQNTLMKGLIDVLRASYPTVERLTGAEWFDSVAQLYARANLPQQPSLALYGEKFPDFLHGISSAAELPYLQQVAQLDRCWTEAHFAADAPLLRAVSLQAIAPQRLQHLQLQLHPAVRVVQVAHSAGTIWRHNRPPATPPEVLEASDALEYMAVMRRAGAMAVEALNAAEYAFLHHLAAGHSLGEAMLELLANYPGIDAAALLARMIDIGLFQGIETPVSPQGGSGVKS